MSRQNQNHFLSFSGYLWPETLAVVIIQLLKCATQSTTTAFFFSNHPVKFVEQLFLVSHRLSYQHTVDSTIQSFFKIYSTGAMFLNIFVVSPPFLSLLLTNSLPLVNNPCNWNVLYKTSLTRWTLFKCFYTSSSHYNRILYLNAFQMFLYFFIAL